MATIVLTGGGSAGHCTPHLSILPYLKKHFDKIYYIGSNNGIEKEIISRTDIPYYGVSCAKLVREFTPKNFTMPFKVIKGIIEASKLLKQLRPDVIFSKGGFVSVPTVIAGYNKKIPVVAHESDFSVGLANKFTSRFCKKVLTTFPDTAKTLKNGEFIGSPIKNVKNFDVEKANAFFGFTNDKPVLTVMGGSLGAKKINDVIYSALDELLPKFNVIHLCGKGNLIKINKSGYYQTEFLHDVSTALSITSVCITRAGSNALFELLHAKTPCVVIPLPKGVSRGDQEQNASYFCKKGLVFVLPQSELTKRSLINMVNGAYANRFNLHRAFDLSPIDDKSQDIAKVLFDYAKNK